jgi:hypothetical protein
MPFVLGGLALVYLRAVVLGTVKELVDSVVVFFYFGAFSLWSFGYKLYRYGHDLSPTAAVQVPPFMPPMFGGRQIANFEVYSYPRAASYAMAGTIVLLAALAWTWWQARRAAPRDSSRARRHRDAARLVVATVLLHTALLAAPRKRVGDDALPPSTGAPEGRPGPARPSPLRARSTARALATIVVPTSRYGRPLHRQAHHAGRGAGPSCSGRAAAVVRVARRTSPSRASTSTDGAA